MKVWFRSLRASWNRNRHSTFVCPECRLAGKKSGICVGCGREMISIGEQWRVPKKTDKRGWSLMVKRMFPREVFPRDKTALVIDRGSYDDFKTCVIDYLDSK